MSILELRFYLLKEPDAEILAACLLTHKESSLIVPNKRELEPFEVNSLYFTLEQQSSSSDIFKASFIEGKFHSSFLPEDISFYGHLLNFLG